MFIYIFFTCFVVNPEILKANLISFNINSIFGNLNYNFKKQKWYRIIH